MKRKRQHKPKPRCPTSEGRVQPKSETHARTPGYLQVPVRSLQRLSEMDMETAMNCACPAHGNPFLGRLCETHLKELSNMNYHLRVALLKMYWSEYLRIKGFDLREVHGEIIRFLRDPDQGGVRAGTPLSRTAERVFVLIVGNPRRGCGSGAQGGVREHGWRNLSISEENCAEWSDDSPLRENPVTKQMNNFCGKHF